MLLECREGTVAANCKYTAMRSRGSFGLAERLFFAVSFHMDFTPLDNIFKNTASLVWVRSLKLQTALLLI
jgi:hypothetical protein